MQNPNTLSIKHFLRKSLMTTPIKKTNLKIHQQISCIIPSLFAMIYSLYIGDNYTKFAQKTFCMADSFG